MDRRTRNRQCQRSGRSGFTLIEVLVVILIIGILMALLVPAVIAAIKKAREAQVTAEMNNLSAALASFKNLYGDYPPSRILLCEQGFHTLTTQQLSAPAGPVTPDGTTVDMTVQQLMARSLIYLNRFQPVTAQPVPADVVGADQSGCPDV
jgi:general secretion pathway protein G